MVLTGAGCKRAQPTPPASDGSAAVIQPASGGVLSAYMSEPSAIDPRDASDLSGMQIDDAIFDSLVRVDPTDPTKLLPSAAETWTANSDNTVWTFKLNPADKFHEGTPVTANDFIYAWNRIADPRGLDEEALVGTASPVAQQLSVIAGYESVRKGSSTEMTGLVAVDDRTLEVTLVHPFADFDYVVAQPSFAPVLRKYVEKAVEYEKKKVPFAQMPIGNGPYKMSAPWIPGKGIKVVRNDDYYGAKAHLDGVQFRVFSGARAAFAEFRSGALDFSPVPSDLVTAAVATGGVSADGFTGEPEHQVLRGDEYGELMLVFNLRDKTVSNANVRKAISLAIDRAALCSGALRAGYAPADNVVPVGVPGYAPAAWTFARFDAKAAKAAVSSAGYRKSKKVPAIKILCDAQSDDVTAVAAVARNLKRIGITAIPEPVGHTTYLERLAAGDYQVGVVDWRAQTPTVDNVLSSLFGSASDGNYSGYSTAAFERGITAARATTIQTERLARYRALNARVAATVPVAPLAFRQHLDVTSSRVHGLVLGGLGTADFTGAWLTEGTSK